MTVGAKTVQHQPPITWIRPAGTWPSLQLEAIWEYRELLYFLVWRDIKVRYKQTALGAAWAIIQPFLTMLVFSLFFGRLSKIPSDGVPYPLFCYTALVPWTFFANGVTMSSNSLVGNANLLSKVYFPRMVVPISSVVSGILDIVLAFIVLTGMMIYYGVRPGIQCLWLPAFFLLGSLACLGMGLWLSALNVRFRDVRYAVPFLVQLWMFSTPIAYPATMLSEKWRALYSLNPMVGVVEGFRWALLNAPAASRTGLAASVAMAFLLLVSGAFYFRRTEKTFADLV